MMKVNLIKVDKVDGSYIPDSFTIGHIIDLPEVGQAVTIYTGVCEKRGLNYIQTTRVQTFKYKTDADGVIVAYWIVTENSRYKLEFLKGDRDVSLSSDR